MLLMRGLRGGVWTAAVLAVLWAGLAGGRLGLADTAPGTGADAGAAADPFLWLEDVSGERAQAWVKAENAKTLDALQKDPRFSGFYDDAKAIGAASDRIPGPSFIGGKIYNFWQDAMHPRGIWRTTSVADYETSTPQWTTVLDLDALAKSEGKNWVWEGADCESPSHTRCLIGLSEGGEDAQTLREFDLVKGAFDDGGFVLPRGKQNATWADEDTLLVAREWEPGQLTASGYAYVTKRLHRGQALSDAVEVARGEKTDVSAGPRLLRDGAGHRALLIDRGVSFFQAEYRWLTASGVSERLAIPLKSAPVDILDGHLLVRLSELWKLDDGSTFPAGALVSLDLAAAQADPQHLKPSLVYAPGPRETLGGVSETRGHLIVSTLENVRGRVAIFTPQAGGAWTREAVALPDNAAIGTAASDENGSTAYLSVTSFLTPTTLYHLDVTSKKATPVKTTSAKFDASGEVVEQNEATSTDGTKIPYFIVHPASIKLDGSNPTILYAYGGFAVSETPSYSGNLGKLWLNRGGVYVLANIRGGGEFGPAWHEAGLTVHRQRIYDDFASVAKDLIARKVTTPAHLGIEGGSNGGLLMGVEFTQHPELWNAVDIQVPLLDMIRFEHIAAGASWVGEYGSVSIPEQREFLASISPYNNLKAGVKYPEPFIWTTTKDDRVGPQHARKFAAKLASLGDPYYFYEVTEGGHGSGANINERAFTNALEFTYFTERLMDAKTTGS
jgi:prolyl oligopeptidase